VDLDIGIRFRYTGQQYLRQLGLYYYKARFYSANLGRFLKPDPIGTSDDLNLYAYVRNDPVNYTDPSGEVAQIIVGGVIGGLSGLVGAFNNPHTSAGGIAQAVTMGAVLGGVSAAIPVGGPLAAAAVRNTLAGFSGNSVGQLVTGGVNNYNARQAVTQGVVGGLAGTYGNALGFATGLNMAKNGATAARAVPTSLGVGSTGAIGVGASLNMMLPSSLGGMNPVMGSNNISGPK
jgi:RHS repeat-associated protein